MKIKITVISIVDIEPDDYREVNDDGKLGPIASFEKICEIIKGQELDQIIFEDSNMKVTIEEI